MAYALRRTDRESARDVVAETFLVAWRRLETAPDNVLPWLIAIARNVLMNQARTARRQDALVEKLGVNLPVTSQEVQPPDDEVAEALAQMSPADRELLTLTFWDDLDRSECAQVLGCFSANVRLRLHRALRRMRRALDSHGSVQPSRLASPSEERPQ